MVSEHESRYINECSIIRHSDRLAFCLAGLVDHLVRDLVGFRLNNLQSVHVNEHPFNILELVPLINETG